MRPPTWSYDAAGNRNDVTAVDNLNRATTISGVNRTYDILGNTLTKGSTTTYTWDVLNRMLSHTASSVTTDYQYRSDGMRVSKDNGTTISKFYYDGQMPIETTEITSSATVVTRNGLGARGIDRIERVGTSTTVGYPIYDGHGNMVATLSKSGSSYSVGDLRSYDAWGGIRSGNTSGDPKGRYCANLGHVDDDESGLTYMRARYYESASGRFVSEDKSIDGLNWFIYARNNPICGSDPTGRSVATALVGLLKFLLGHALMDMITETTSRMENITRYMSQLDELIQEANMAGKWADDALELRKEYIALNKQLKRMRAMEFVRSKVSGVATLITKLLGYNLILSSLIDDISLATSGLGSLDAVYG